LAFAYRVYELGRTLKSEVMAYWELYQNSTHTGHYIEIRMATWRRLAAAWIRYQKRSGYGK